MRRLLVVLCFAQFLFAQSADVEVGKGNFRLYCAPCHGIHAQGGRGPDLTQTTADLAHTISEGVPGTEMGAYSSQFDEAMIARIVSYIRSTARGASGPVAGDPEHGRALFVGTANCAGCHTAGGVGPSLARVGRQRSPAYLREKLLHPSTEITPGYETLIVTLKDGNTVRGIRRCLDDFSAQLIGLDRRFYSFRRNEVASIEKDSHSLMPDQKLTEPELTDLLAYLSTLRGDAK
jgi:putative heme-binding domain-containing protein